MQLDKLIDTDETTANIHVVEMLDDMQWKPV